MKQIIALLLLFLVLFMVPGCSRTENPHEDTLLFYYLRNSEDYVYGTFNGVVTSESRDGSTQSAGTAYLLSLYLQGPLDESLRSPFPAGCRVTNLVTNGNEITLVLNTNFTTLKGVDRTLACVCLARTCMSLTGAELVHIQAETFDGQQISIESITLDSLLHEETRPIETP